MSAGSHHLLLLPVCCVEKVWLSSGSSSSINPSTSAAAALVYGCSSSSFPSGSSSSGAGSLCMRQRGAKGSKTGSMRLKLVRCGFGVKYFGFLHIRGFFFLFLFLRGACT